jgi:uncharacterized protein YkvS
MILQEFKGRPGGLRTLTVALCASLTLLILGTKPSRADAVISDCSVAALRSALAEGGTVAFAKDCSITFTAPISITNVVKLDAGGHTVTLSGGGQSRLFIVESGAELGLAGLSLTGGKATVGAGLYVKAGGVAAVSNCVFSTHQAVGANGSDGPDGAGSTGIGESGGAGGTGATASGGAVYNAGIFRADRSRFLTNSAVGGAGGQGGDGGSGLFGGGNGGAGGDGGAGLGGAIYSVGSLTLTDCSFEGNAASGGDGGSGGSGGSGPAPGLKGVGGAGAVAYGAAVYSINSARIERCTFSANAATGGDSAAGGTLSGGNGSNGAAGAAAAGAGLWLAGSGAITNCTVYGNRALGGAGGAGGPGQFYGGNGGDGGNGVGAGLYSAGTLYVVHTTIAQNSAVGGTNGVAGSGISGPGTSGSPGMGLGGGVARGSGVLWLRSSALSGNTSGGNGYGTITDGGYNLSSDLSIPLTGTSRWLADPLLGALADNGGPTKTMALLSGSPALDKVPAAATPATDQRGLSRPINSLGDIGAYEAGFFVSGTVALGATGLANVAVMAGTNVVLTDAAGRYETSLPGGAVEITPTLEGFQFSPSRVAFTVASNTANVNFAATQLLSVSGQVIEFTNGLPGVVVSVGTNLTLSGPDGFYRAWVLPGSYTVTPQLGCFRFTPANRSVSVNSNLSGLDFIAGRESFRISGWIKEGTNGLGGVEVKVGTNSVVTDASGAFVVTGLCAGNYLVQPTRPQFEFEPASRSINLGPDNDGATFSAFELFSLSGAVLEGTNGLVNVRITVGTNVVTTGTDGRYSISTLRKGQYDVTPALGCYHFEPTSRTAVNVGPGGVNSVDFAAARDAYTIGGSISSDGKPLSGVSVNIGGANVTTGTNGIYSLGNLCAGTYQVTPTLSGYVFSPASLPIKVGPDTNAVNFTGIPVFSLSGRVADGTNGMTGVTVLVGTNQVITGSNGLYSISGLKSGTYKVKPSLACYHFTPTELSIPLGPSTNNVDFAAFRDNYTVSGRITTGNNQGVSGVAVQIGNKVSGTDTNGNFVLGGLCAGNYSLVPTLAGYDFEPPQLPVTLGPDRSGVSFQAFPVFSISGRVLEGSNGLSGIKVLAVSANKTNSTLSSAGQYVISGLRSNLYTVTPSAQGYAFVPPSRALVVGAGTAGVDFAAYPLLSISRGTNRLISLGFSPASGLRYRIEAISNLAAASNPAFWQAIATNTAPFQITDPQSTNLPARFYRMRQIP